MPLTVGGLQHDWHSQWTEISPPQFTCQDNTYRRAQVAYCIGTHKRLHIVLQRSLRLAITLGEIPFCFILFSFISSLRSNKDLLGVSPKALLRIQRRSNSQHQQKPRDLRANESLTPCFSCSVSVLSYFCSDSPTLLLTSPSFFFSNLKLSFFQEPWSDKEIQRFPLLIKSPFLG